jgi:hypothetical protein
MDISTSSGIPAVLRFELGRIVPVDSEQNHFFRHRPNPAGADKAGKGDGGAADAGAGGKKRDQKTGKGLITAGGRGSGGRGGRGQVGGRGSGAGAGQPSPVASSNLAPNCQTSTTVACMSKLMHDLGVLNLRGNVYGDCTRPACPFKHIDVPTTPKPDLEQHVNDLAAPRPNGLAPLLKPEVVQQAMDKVRALP